MTTSSIASTAVGDARPSVSPGSRVHLLVVCHGLWGTRAHVAYICKSALQHVSPSTSALSKARGQSPSRQSNSDVKLVVLPASLNENTLTYDGIDVCGERVVKEIDDEIARLAENGSKVERFSIVGYSLGGLVARYTLGLLQSRTPSFFDDVRPVNFTTFASPAIGIPQYKTFWSKFIHYLGARFLSRSGSQLYENDRFLPSSIAAGNNQPQVKAKRSLFGKKEQAMPLLAVMADPRYSFYKALLRFERVDIYANAVKDRTVPYPTGAIESHDPFALARAKATKIAEARGEDTRLLSKYVIDIEEGGLKVITKPGVHLIDSYHSIALPASATRSPTDPAPSKPWRLPSLLRPSSYPFSPPVSVAAIVLLPVAFPALLIFLMGRFALEGRGSRQRIKSHRATAGGDGADSRGDMLSRVGVRLQEVMETTSGASPETAVAGGEDGEGLVRGGRSREEEEEAEPIRAHPAFAAFASYGGTETPPMSRGGEPDAEGVTLTATLENGEPLPTDPILTPAQVQMIKNLNAIPQLRKHLAYLPHVRNAHASIVARDLSYSEHKDNGVAIVDTWAKDFLL